MSPLSSFDVAARLKCGEDVEIVGRVEGYVKIRAHDNLEGYVPEAAVADLPPLKIHQDPSQDVGLVAKQAQAKEIAKAAAREAFPAPADSTPTKTAPVSVLPVQLRRRQRAGKRRLKVLWHRSRSTRR